MYCIHEVILEVQHFYYDVYCDFTSVLINTFILIGCVTCPITMYGVKLFIVVLQELQCLLNCLRVGIIGFTLPSFVALYLSVSEIAN